MKSKAYVASAAALAAFLGGTAALAGAGQMSSSAAPSTTSAPAVTPLPHVQALLDGYVRDDKMPGIVTAFGFGDAPPIFVSAGHTADTPGAPLAGPDSLWRVYSMTKPITAMAAMILIEDGKLKLDQPVSDILPAFKAMKVLTDPDHSLASRPAVRPITIRNLLTHTAGLGYNIVTTGPLLAEYNRLGINPSQVNTLMEMQARKTRPATLQEFANRVATLPLIADPGTKWSYSIGLDVMGAVIEKASGMPFDTFVQRRIFTPLKMRSSYFTVPRSEAGRLVTEYAFKREGMAMLFPGAKADDTIGPKERVPLDPAASSVYLNPPEFPYGGAGLVMSARDYDRFLHALANYGTLDGARVLKPETARLMMSNLLPAGVTFRLSAVSAAGGSTAPMGFGAGGSVYLADVPGGPAKGTYGWAGAAGTVAFVDPVRKVRGTVMVNYFPAEKWPLRAEIMPALFADLASLQPRR